MNRQLKCRTFVSNLECVILEASILLKPQNRKNTAKNELKCTYFFINRMI